MTTTPTGPVVLISGATSGIGLATAKLLAGRGFRVFGTSRRPPADGPPGYELLELEVTDDASVTRCVGAVLERTGGRLDVLINNVGTGILGAAEESPADQVRALFDINLLGAVRLTNAVLPTMRAQKSGRVLNMSSSGGTASIPFAAYYCASKFALEAYSEGLRAELLPLGIWVSVVAPGPVSTPAGETAMRSSHPLPAYEPARSRAVTRFVEGIKQGMPPERVAARIHEILQSSNPAPRYPVGFQSWATGMARRALPTRTFQALVRYAIRPGQK